MSRVRKKHPSEVSLFGWGSGDRKGANEAARPGALEEVEAQPFTQFRYTQPSAQYQ